MNTTGPDILVVEGVDGVGKTALAKALATALGFRYLYTPQPPLASIRKELESLRDPNTRFFYYLTSVVAIQKWIMERLESNQGVVIDRYIYSTLAMHQLLGVDISCVNVDKLPIVFPTVSILLTASAKTREERLVARSGLQTYDRHIEQSTALLDRAQVAFRKVCPWSIIINTDSLSAEMVLRKVLHLLKEKGHV
ncbi:MAG: hypothetical protein ABI747_00330 [Candidatus Moraniibacteriota bacterium]